jgi:hypothetical protein
LLKFLGYSLKYGLIATKDKIIREGKRQCFFIKSLIADSIINKFIIIAMAKKNFILTMLFTASKGGIENKAASAVKIFLFFIFLLTNQSDRDVYS